MNTADLEEAVLHLSLQERARLAQKLLDSVDHPSDSEVRELWLLEAKRRADQIDCGVMKLVTSEELEMQVQAIVK